MDYIKLIYSNVVTLKTITLDKNINIKIWIDTVLKESNIKINKPYSIIEADEWGASDNTIYVKKNYQEDDPYLNKAILKHEVKHLLNNDVLKSKILIGVSSFLTIQLLPIPILSLFVLCMSLSINILYWRYFEGEADRFAYEHATDRREIEQFQQFFLNHKQLIDHIVYHSSYKVIRDNPELCLNLFEWMINISHPLCKSRADMAAQYLNKYS